MRLAIKIGGSIAVGERGPNQDYVQDFLSVINSLKLERLGVGIGGGKLARNYLASIGALLSSEQRELVVIELLRANTKMLSILLKAKAIYTEEDLIDVAGDTEKRAFVIGGISPGRSTDANTSLLAEAIEADLFIKLTDVDGVYTADPDEKENAELIKRMTFEELTALSVEGSPGSYGILDRMAISVLRRACIPVRIINGRDPKIIRGLLGGEDIGTLITGP